MPGPKRGSRASVPPREKVAAAAPAEDAEDGAAPSPDEVAAARGKTPSEVSKTERILNLVSYLLKERRPVSWREIVGRVTGYDDGSDPKSLERRFERDKAALKEMGVRIIYCPPGMHETEGYLIPREACFLDRLELMPHESALLNLLSELALRKGGSSFSADLMSALQKLRFDAPRTLAPTPPACGSATREAAPKKKRGRPRKDVAPPDVPAKESRPGNPLESSLLDLDLAAAPRSDPKLELLAQALLANRRAAFTYFSMRSNERRRREVDPYGLGFSRGAWYVVGFDHLRKKIQQFRIDRIEGTVELVGAERAFKPPRDFKMTDYLEKLPWQMADRPPIEARIRVARDIAFFVEDLLAGRTAVDVAEDGAAILGLEVRDRSSFVKWVLAHLRHIEILEPADLRSELAAVVEGIRRKHSAPGSGKRTGTGTEKA